MQTLQTEMHHIPIEGTIGDKGTERRFCKRARSSILLGHAIGEPCPSRKGVCCTLTGERHRCLFWAPDDALWERIALDLEYEAS